MRAVTFIPRCHSLLHRNTTGPWPWAQTHSVHVKTYLSDCSFYNFGEGKPRNYLEIILREYEKRKQMKCV